VVAVRDDELRVHVDPMPEDTKLGDSIAVDGVDLTVTRIDGDRLTFNVMPETFRRTRLGRLAEGARVNIEPSLRAGDRLSGHIVRGVVEDTGTLDSRHDDGDAVIMTYAAPADLLERIVERGPICIDGVSLTVIAKTATTFSVSVVKFTQAHTTTLERGIGEPVNLETDILMRYVVQALGPLLARAGSQLLT
jgi:riboflavin synthase